MHRSLKIKAFQLTSNDPTSLIEKTIFNELGLCCSKYCVSTADATIVYCSYYSNTGVLQPSPFKKSRPEIYEEREVHRKTKNGRRTTSMVSAA
jgi:hypothetical protein